MREPLHIKKFNDKIQAMNQSHGRELKLTAAEARSLHHDIFELLDIIRELKDNRPPKEERIVISMDAGDNSL